MMEDGNIEYPLWALTEKNCPNHKIRIENINVTNESNKLEHEFGLDRFIPDLIVSITGQPGNEIPYQAQVYHPVWSAPPIYIYQK